MEVKEVLKNIKIVSDRTPQQDSTRQRPIDQLNTTRVVASTDESVAVNLDRKARKAEETAVRAKTNDAISVVNLADEATQEIEKLVKSIDGIAEQAQKPELAPQRRAVLEKEANELVEEIKRQADTATPSGVKPLAGDKIVVELEKELGKTLEILLPDDASKGLDLGKIEFSAKENILRTIANVRKAQERLEGIRDAVYTVKDEVAAAAMATDVAVQNSEASEVSVRNVDDALKLANDTGSGIGSDPEKALKSVSKLTATSLDLLEA